MDELQIKKNNDKNDVTREEYLRALTRSYTGIEKPLKGFAICESLDDLVKKLHCIFESNYINIEYVHHLMLSYKSNRKDWKKYAKFDRYRYTRNLVDGGNGKFNLMILCWGEAHASAIHDHADSHCFMKMLKGELTEVRFAWPKDRTIHNSENGDIGNSHDKLDEFIGDELQEIGRSKLELNGVAYINDTLGLHRVENSSHTEPAVSLHLYCPPFDECSIFNKKTGKRTKCQVTFWSKYGEKRNKEAFINSVPEDK
ncbi:cysteine dioxygenase type 1 [Culicoides brevitarsis]|uniref:cysteine dioxygenase type 1 n=1 Tax=Culicoides brevitarsis TaxID=469753 RepID=UPI00307B7CD7